MTQTNSFLDSPLPSLYDVAQDLYGPPQKLRDQEQTIALGMTDKTEERKAPPDNLRPNREFPTSRKSPRQANTPPGRSARALFEVEGPTPLHIRVLSFDRFDGRAWHEAPMNGRRIYVEKDSASNWMLLSKRELPIFAGSETHAFKLAAPEGSFIPTPPHLTRFRVGRVDRTNFFAWAHDRVLRFADRKTPSGIVVETECRTVDRRRLASLDFDHHDPIGRFDYDAVPAGIDPALVALAHEWGVGCAPGWPRIAAIVERLRSDYVHDTAYSPPPDCADPLAHFLLEARRGPDYQFASAAAVLVRIAGYPTRLVSGFYAHPHHYDAETKHTPVVKEDLHFWAEVMLPNGDWLVLEPTPGYEVAPARLSLSERVLAAIEALAEWTWRNAVAVGLTLIALVVVCGAPAGVAGLGGRPVLALLPRTHVARTGLEGGACAGTTRPLGRRRGRSAAPSRRGCTAPCPVRRLILPSSNAGSGWSTGQRTLRIHQRRGRAKRSWRLAGRFSTDVH